MKDYGSRISINKSILQILKGDDLIVECKLCMNLVRLKDGFGETTVSIN